jgi:hypothetical protein
MATSYYKGETVKKSTNKCDNYTSKSSNIRVIKSRRFKQAGHIAIWDR